MTVSLGVIDDILVYRCHRNSLLQAPVGRADCVAWTILGLKFGTHGTFVGRSLRWCPRRLYPQLLPVVATRTGVHPLSAEAAAFTAMSPTVTARREYAAPRGERAYMSRVEGADFGTLYAGE